MTHRKTKLAAVPAPPGKESPSRPNARAEKEAVERMIEAAKRRFASDRDGVFSRKAAEILSGWIRKAKDKKAA